MKKLFILVIVSFFSFSIHSQQWIRMANEGATLTEIKSEMDILFEGKSSIKGDANYDRAYKKYLRWEYFWRFNTTSDDKLVGPKQVLKSFKERKAETILRTASWSFVGQNTIPTATDAAYAGMGRVNCFAFNPANANEMWAGTANGGLWHSTNAGTDWAATGGTLPVLGISDIAVSANGMTLYIATGDSDGQHSLSVGIMKSTDGGATFSPTGYTHTVNNDNDAMFQINSMLIHPSNANILLVGSTSNLQKTTNGGTSWTTVDNNETTDIKMKPGDINTIYADIFGEIWKSTDVGDNWSFSTVMPNSNKSDLAVSGSTVYAIADNGTTAKKSVNNGSTWSNMTLPSNFNTQGGYNMCITADPSNPDRVFLGGINGYVSTNGGTTWALHLNGVWAMNGDPGKYVHSDHHMAQFYPGNNNLLYVAHDGGIHKGDFFNLGADWIDLSEDLTVTQYYGMDGFASNASFIIAGAQDQDGVWYNGTTWKNINNNSDGTGGRINTTNSNISFCKSQSGLLTRTLNAWTGSTGVGPDADADFVWPLEMDQTTPTTLYGGYDNIYKTTNNGNSWTNITNHSNSDYYSDIAIATTNSNRLYAVRSNSIITTSTNAGSTWSAITSPFTGAQITGIHVSLTNESTIYLTYGNYTAGSKVFKSTNAGSTWTNISSGLPNIPTYDIVENATNNDIFLGTFYGVYKSTNGGTTWTAYNSGLPPVAVREMDIHQTSQVLRAATFGRAIWQTPLGGGVDCPTSLTLTGANTGGDFESSGDITSTQIINAGATVDYDSATSIEMLPGFESTLGAIFQAFIDGCGGNQ